MAEVELSDEMEKGCLKRQTNDQDKEIRGEASTSTEVEISDEMETGCVRRQPNDQGAKIKEALAIKITDDIKRVRSPDSNSISKVPAHMVAVNPDAFTPKMLSMGPYHHGEDHLKPMEEHKRTAARYFIAKSQKPIEDYIEALWKVLPDLMDSYPQLSDSWRTENGGRFLTLMLIDGCFLLEMLSVCSNKFDGYEENDPIFSRKGVISMPQIAIDLMMLENQVPFTTIETLLTVQNGRTQQDEIFKEIKNLMSIAKLRPVRDLTRGLHILDIVRKALVEQDEYKGDEYSMTEGHQLRWRFMQRRLSKEDTHHPRSKMNGATRPRSVMELRRAGVKFQVPEDDSHSRIEFKNSTLTIPINHISNESEILVCNMVAFELLRPGKLPSILCHYTFMNGLLNSAADVRHLRSVGIISGTESRDYVISKTFKKLVPVNITMNAHSYLHGIQVELNKFYIDSMTGRMGKVWEWIASWKHIWIPILKKKYLRNPWTIISLAGAIILLALTMAQTYYAARSYWDSSHKKN